MEIKELRALRGPNYYHRLPVIFMQLDIGSLEYQPSNEVPDFRENIEKMMPSLIEHTCSPGVRGGFFQRVERGTWPGHIVEHVAIELQVLIGHNITYGKTITLSTKGLYNLAYRYMNEVVGLRAGEMAVELVLSLYGGKVPDVQPYLDELKYIAEETEFGPSTQSIVDEAVARNIPYYRLNEHSYVQLGLGKNQRRIEATLMDDTSSLGVSIAANKFRTKEILSENGVPVPKGEIVRDIEDLTKVCDKLGFPLVVKPLDGNHGRGITTDINNLEDLERAYVKARHISSVVVVEQFLVGHDYRLLVINNKLVAAALREPAAVVGDSHSNIQELIEELNQDPRRGDGHNKVLTKVIVNDETFRTLKLQGLDLESVPKEGDKIYIKETANISTGGTATDVTDSIHHTVQLMAERISKLVGLNVCGIDLIARDIERPLEAGKEGVVEVNAGPGFRMHLAPSWGQARNVAAPVLDMLFPEGQPSRIPITAVTGTNGKTTTTRLIAHILSSTGMNVGMASTDGVYINQHRILEGDYSGPDGASTVFKDPTVDHAVLEVARGGIIRRGLGFPMADVGVFTNLSSDHLGYGDMENLEDLARLKGSVTSSVSETGYAVFNADDPIVLEQADKTRGHVVLFSLDPENPALRANLAHEANFNVTVENEEVVVQRPGGKTNIVFLRDVPVTFDGLATFNVLNVLAATGAAIGLGVTKDQIAMGLRSFNPTTSQAPGRMNIIDIADFKVVVDYSHNVGSVLATGEFLEMLMPGRKIRLCFGVGNRRDQDIIDYGEAIAQYFDQIVLSDPTPRGRQAGETVELMRQGLHQGGISDDAIQVVTNEQDAVRAALETAQPGDLVVFQVLDVERAIDDVLDYKLAYLEQMQVDEVF